MKFFRFSMLVVLTAAVALGGVGCKRKPKPSTPIPGQSGPIKDTTDTTQRDPIGPGSGGVVPNAGITSTPAYVTPAANLDPNSTGTPLGTGDISNMDRDDKFFSASTVYFDYDRAAVRAAERVRVEEVAAHLKAKPTHMVQIEGHCDERGTEEYNRALGERRALAVREYLINAGIQAERVHTISFGEDRPKEIGSGESAWAKNRRGEFILLTPRQ